MKPTAPHAALAVGDLTGEVSEVYRRVPWQDCLATLVDAGSAKQTLHWGRNYLYVVPLETPEEKLDVVVKQFRHDSFKPRLRRAMRGTKAERTWRAAQVVQAAGLATPEPILYADHRDSDGPAFYVCRYEPERLEARYLLRALNSGIAEDEFPEIDARRFLEVLGTTLARMHEADIWHRDMTSGNVLLHCPAFAPGASPDEARPPALSLIDLSRARFGRRLSLMERMRDLSRMPILRVEDQKTYLRAYFDAAQMPPRKRASAARLYRVFHRSFLLKNSTKQRVRGGLRSVAEALLPRRAPHTHIPEADPSASRRDKIVWDDLSDQPHQHASRWEKTLVRLGDSPRHLATLATLAVTAPRIRRRYREISRQTDTSASWRGAGVALRPYPQDPEALLRAVSDLGVKHVLLRLLPWQEDHHEEESLARALASQGVELSFSLPQSRDLVKDPERWRASVRRLGETFAPMGRAFQVGQAINRSKWGVWHSGEYVDLLLAARKELRAAREDAMILGPSVIDFEFHSLVALLNTRRQGVEFDAVASLLYVDRRGAPENEQMGLDTVGKVRLLKSIAETSRNCPSGRVWITEVNWPLREGPHSPAGRDVAVSEEAQADYLVRYYVLVMTTGLVERVFWWQPIAKGYGLIDPEGSALRRRASFHALSDLSKYLRGRQYAGREVAASPAVHMHRFVGDRGGAVIVAWCTADSPVTAEPPADVVYRAYAGKAIEKAKNPLKLGSRPQFLLDEEARSSLP